MHTPHCWSTQTHYTSNHHTHTIALTHPVTHPIIYPTRVLKSPTYLSLHWGTVAKTCRYIYHIRCQTSTHKQMHRLLAREPHNNKPPSPSRYYIPPIYTLCNIVQGRYRYMRDLQSLNTARPQKQPTLPHSAALITIPLNRRPGRRLRCITQILHLRSTSCPGIWDGSHAQSLSI